MTLSDLTKERIIESLSTWIENDLAQILDVGENEAVREAEQEAKNDADAADVKDAESQTTAERNEPKRADDKQQDVNEQLERQ